MIKLSKLKRLLSGLLVIAMASSLAACSGSSTKTDTGTNTNNSTSTNTSGTASPATPDRPSWAKKADEITGTLNVYTTMEETQQESLRKIWSKYYPNSKLQFQSDSIGTLVTRLKSESSAPVADVLIGGLFEADGTKYHDVLQPYTSVNDAQLNYHDKSGYYTLYDVQVMCLIVNKDLTKKLGVEIKGYQDLLQPQLAGKIIMAEPAASSSAYRQLQTILATMGDKFDDEKGWNYIKQLMVQAKGIITNSSSQVYNDVIKGEYVVGLSYESTVQAMIAQGATNVECVYMKEGNTAMAGGAGIVKGSKNLVAAKAMMDLLASSEFQDARAKESSGRGTNSQCKDSGLPKDSTLNIKKLDFDYLNTNKNQLMDKWATLWKSTK
jgi:iron(III) transport system substrate-binding protein